jgi:3-deoxy-D-manno-octulosonic acid kinase
MTRTKAQSTMDPQQLKLESGVIVYDAEIFSHAKLLPETAWFRPDYWETQGLVRSRQRGRGTALMIRTPVGPSVLRQYLRGGWAAKFIRSRYAFTGYQRSRPVREFRVLERLAKLDLPAPRPVAALCERYGWSTSGALITLEIENVRPLEQVAGRLDEAGWRSVGAVIRRFHDNGLVHADLTVRNILIQEGGKVFLVDFDRARFRAQAKLAFRNNLKRLRRSMVKSRREQHQGMNQKAWMQLLKGYESSGPND